MKKNYLINYNLSPDSLTGSICGIEGIKDAIALVNGPTGCRMSNAYLVYGQDRYVDYTADNARLSDDYFMRQFRVPSTFLDEYDFIFSTEDKLIKILKRIDSNNFYKLLGLVNTSGTALIGDDLEKIIKKSGFSKNYVIVETTGFVNDMYTGFQNVIIDILEKALNNRKIARNDKSRSGKSHLQNKNNVNLIGFSLAQHNWFNDLDEIKQLLALLGIEINVVLCVDTEYEELQNLPDAKLNIIISEEYGLLIGKYLYEKTGVPYLAAEPMDNAASKHKMFSPYGFDFTEDFVEMLSGYFSIERNKYHNARDRAKRRIFKVLQNISGTRNVIKGLSFGIFADSYKIYPFLKILYEYLGLYPALIGLRGIGNNNIEEIKFYIKSKNLSSKILETYNQFDLKDALEKIKPDIILGSCLEKNIFRLIRKDFAFINISLPEDEKTVLTFRPFMGINGMLTLVEDLINSIKVINFNYRY